MGGAPTQANSMRLPLVRNECKSRVVTFGAFMTDHRREIYQSENGDR
jgi:hypothetical protein